MFRVRIDPSDVPEFANRGGPSGAQGPVQSPATEAREVTVGAFYRSSTAGGHKGLPLCSAHHYTRIFLGAIVAFGAIAFVAALVPALRTTRVDPAIALTTA